jgi:hypothetical protein
MTVDLAEQLTKADRQVGLLYSQLERRNNEVANLREKLQNLEHELQAERTRTRSTEDSIIASTAHPRLVELNAALGVNRDNRGRLWAFLGALQAAVEAQDPLRSPVPHESGVAGDSALTPTEAAVVSKRKARTLVRNLGTNLDEWTEGIWNRLDRGGDWEDRKPRGRQCKRRDCEQRNRKRQHTPLCGWCGADLGEEAA